jgi:hypothetical protein
VYKEKGQSWLRGQTGSGSSITAQSKPQSPLFLLNGHQKGTKSAEKVAELSPLPK